MTTLHSCLARFPQIRFLNGSNCAKRLPTSSERFLKTSQERPCINCQHQDQSTWEKCLLYIPARLVLHTPYHPDLSWILLLRLCQYLVSINIKLRLLFYPSRIRIILIGLIRTWFRVNRNPTHSIASVDLLCDSSIDNRHVCSFSSIKPILSPRQPHTALMPRFLWYRSTWGRWSV